MKRIFLSFTCFLFMYCLSAQNKYSWSWEGGDIPSHQSGMYGIKGVAGAYNHPGEREAAVSWKNAAGTLWLFGGHRVLSTSFVPALNLNDLWTFTAGTNQWTWVSGDNTPDQLGVYGTKGITAPSNKPGARQASATWTDASGTLWLYGGVAPDNLFPKNTIYFSDLWKYEPAINQWTWVNGSNANYVNSNHGLQGVASTSNTPGARTGSISWVDVSGNFWLFGGFGSASNGAGYENDLWKYNPGTNQWTWMHGDTTALLNGDNVSLLSVFGTKGIRAAANKPGARSGAVGCTDRSGNFWLFGGQREQYPTVVHYNDLWKYDVSTNQWAWISGDSAVNARSVYGIKGIAAAGNAPGSRVGAQSWTDSSGKLWLFGGAFDVNAGKPKALNDLWSYDETGDLWTWVRGDSSPNSPGIYQTKGTASADNEPAARYSSLGWQDGAGNCWLFGGGGNPVIGSSHKFNDLWKYNAGSGQWTWASGDQRLYSLSVSGIKGTPDAANKPGSRTEAVSWTDTAGDLWLFGGENGRSLNDLWRYDHIIKQWTLVNGDTLQDQQPVYGTRNVPDGNNNPGARNSAVGWADRSGNLWLFGGRRNLTTGSTAYMNDLWKFDTKTTVWSWVSGDSAASTIVAPLKGVYGSKGIAHANNKPYPRFNALGLTDTAGNFWLFGGSSIGVWVDATLNDLWKFDITTNQWTWMSGDSTYADYQHPLPPVYGTKGVASNTSKPGSKTEAVGWSDLTGNLWIYSGPRVDYSGTVDASNDLWKYNIATGYWTWVQGDIYLGRKGLYGKKGIANPDNQPGSRSEAVSWRDTSGNCWMFGGSGADDLWKFDPASTVWTWISGDSTSPAYGVYPIKGIPDTNVTPGARTSAVSWTDKSGNMWLLGGTGRVNVYFSAVMNDLWKISYTDLVLPLKFTSFSAVKNNGKVVLHWNTGQEINNAYFIIERSANGISYDSIGIVAARTDGLAASNEYRFLDADPYRGNNYYRIKQIDKDGHYTYSTVTKVLYKAPDFNCLIISNPVQDQVTMNFQSDEAKKLQILITDAGGRLLYKEQTAVTPGNTGHAIPCATLKKGMYFLTVKSPKTQMTKSFMKE